MWERSLARTGSADVPLPAVCFQHDLVPGLSGIAIVDTSSLVTAFRTRSHDPRAEPRDLLKDEVSPSPLARPPKALTLVHQQFLALLCFFQGAKISNHSAIIGPSSAPAFIDYPFSTSPSTTSSRALSNLGSRRLGVMLALHDQVSTLFDALNARSGASLPEKIERVVLTCLVIWSTFSARRIPWMHKTSGEGLKVGVGVLEEMKALGVPSGQLMACLADLAALHYMVSGMYVDGVRLGMLVLTDPSLARRWGVAPSLQVPRPRITVSPSLTSAAHSAPPPST